MRLLEGVQAPLKSEYNQSTIGFRRYCIGAAKPLISIDRAIYVGLAALLGLAIWFVTKTGYPPSLSEKPNRHIPVDPRTSELLRARKTVQRQIEQQQSWSWGRQRGEYSKDGIRRLKAILAEIEAEFNELKGPPAK